MKRITVVHAQELAELLENVANAASELGGTMDDLADEDLDREERIDTFDRVEGEWGDLRADWNALVERMRQQGADG